MNFKLLQSFIASLLIFTCSCGYQFQGSGSVLPEDIKTVYVERVQNETTYSGVDLQLREAIKDRFDRYGVVTVVDQKDLADAVVSARILSIGTLVKDVTGRSDIELEQDLVISIFAELVTTQGQTLWRNPNLQVTQSIASVGDVVVTSSSDFAQGGISAGTLGSLGSREVARGQAQASFDDLTQEAARQLYLDAVAADF